MEKRNFKKSEMLEFKYQNTGEAIRFPIGTIYGKEEGPTLVVLGGMHGSEFCGIQSAIELFNKIEPEDLKGTLIVGTIYNMSAFKNHTAFLVPQDGKNPMSTFPGKLNGTYGEVMAHHFTENVLSKADYFIELHGGDIPEALTQFVMQTKTEDEELNSKIKDMAEAYNIPLIINIESKPSEKPGGAFIKMIQRGIPSILTESGQQGILDKENTQIHLTGLLNVMKKLEMINGEIVDDAERIQLKYNGAIRNETPGMWYPFVELNQKVKKDEIVGEIRDYFGKHITDIKAPIDGLITVVRTSPSVGEKNVLVELHEILES